MKARLCAQWLICQTNPFETRGRAQAHGLTLGVGQVIVIAITATLAAIGAASIPMSALVSMITVLQAVRALSKMCCPLHVS